MSEVKSYALERVKDHQKSLEPSCSHLQAALVGQLFISLGVQGRSPPSKQATPGGQLYVQGAPVKTGQNPVKLT